MTRYLTLLLTIFFYFIAEAQSEKTYADGHGSTVTLPFGDISFADTLIFYRAGIPSPVPESMIAEDALGVADFREGYIKGFVSLGTGGELVLGFSDNVLVDVEGPDLYVFEVGRHIEETILYVSNDLKSWKKVGQISGGNARVDIAGAVSPGEVFRYVKLVDARSAAHRGDRMWPGADIDAVAAIGSARQISFDASFLFESGRSVLNPRSLHTLDSVSNILLKLENYQVEVQGHTDSTGSRDLNEKLSEQRALAVKNHFVKRHPALKSRIITSGFADTRPVADNATETGRQRNRRVEVLIYPFKKSPSQGNSDKK